MDKHQKSEEIRCVLENVFKGYWFNVNIERELVIIKPISKRINEGVFLYSIVVSGTDEQTILKTVKHFIVGEFDTEFPLPFDE